MHAIIRLTVAAMVLCSGWSLSAPRAQAADLDASADRVLG